MRSMASTGVLTHADLEQQNRRFEDSGGVSHNNRCHAFHPAFFDAETGVIYLSKHCDGRLACMHLLDGLPEQLVVERNEGGHVVSVKPSIVVGFERDGMFYTRDEAAKLVEKESI